MENVDGKIIQVSKWKITFAEEDDRWQGNQNYGFPYDNLHDGLEQRMKLEVLMFQAGSKFHQTK